MEMIRFFVHEKTKVFQARREVIIQNKRKSEGNKSCDFVIANEKQIPSQEEEEEEEEEME